MSSKPETTVAKKIAKSTVPKPTRTSKKATEKKNLDTLQNGSLMPNLRRFYHDNVVNVMQREFDISNLMRVPKIVKVNLNIGLGEAVSNSSSLAAAVNDITKITGQKPGVRRAKKSISNFSLREGQVVGVSVCLRKARMWYFLDRFINVALTRVRDFRGLPLSGFDGRGNYTIGLREQTIFPEIDYNDIDKLRGLQVTMVTSAPNDEEGLRLLELLGMPFVRTKSKNAPKGTT